MKAAGLKAVAAKSTTPLIYVALLLVWEFCARLFQIPSWILPSPTAIAASTREWAPELAFNTYITIRETIIGFALSLFISLPLAIVIAFTSTLRRLVYPILLGLQSVPKVALAPLIILWLGIGDWPKIVIVVLVCFFPILVNVVAGFEAAPRPMLDLMHSLRASKYSIFRLVRAPIALPHLFTGCKIAITFAVIGAVIGEFVAAQEGLGYMILMSTAQSRTPLAFAAIILLTVISVVLFYAVEVLERAVVNWRD
jgi:NitT/TauT family transport system permease protein